MAVSIKAKVLAKTSKAYSIWSSASPLALTFLCPRAHHFGRARHMASSGVLLLLCTCGSPRLSPCLRQVFAQVIPVRPYLPALHKTSALSPFYFFFLSTYRDLDPCMYPSHIHTYTLCVCMYNPYDVHICICVYSVHLLYTHIPVLYFK